MCRITRPSNRPLLCYLVLCVIATGTSRVAAQQEGQDHHVVTLSSGRDTFNQFCAPCHGADGKGKGPIAAMLVGAPADLTQVRRRNGGSLPLDNLEQMLRLAVPLAESHGSQEMPIWGATFVSIDGSEALARARIATLVAYIDSIQE